MSRIFSEEVNWKKAAKDLKAVGNWGVIKSLGILVTGRNISSRGDDMGVGIAVFMNVDEGKDVPTEYGLTLLSLSQRKIDLFLKSFNGSQDEAWRLLSVTLDCFAFKLKKKLEREMGREIDGLDYMDDSVTRKKMHQYRKEFNRNNDFGLNIVKAKLYCFALAK